MRPETHRLALRRAAYAGDWIAAERAGRAYGWALLRRALGRALSAPIARLAAWLIAAPR
jgi:hypothetical protein